jgi:hypothetical protein
MRESFAETTFLVKKVIRRGQGHPQPPLSG